MTKYHFIKYKDNANEFDFATIIYEVDSDDMGDVIQGMSDFLKASGHCFKGRLAIIEDEE